MVDISIYMSILLVVASFIAGTIDTLAGGGGLITVPVLLLSGVNPVLALGTDKLQSAIGEFSATLHFLRHGKVNYKVIYLGIFYTVIGAVIGTISLQYVPVHQLEKIIPILLLAVFGYYVLSSRKKHNYTIENVSGREHWFFIPVSTLIGFYNGFFGPGTGTLWTISFIQFLHLNIKKATMYTKPLNLAANMAALIVFIYNGQINFKLAILMGLGSFAGGKYGAKLVIYKDSRWLKIAFLSLMAFSTIGTFIKYY